MSDNVWADQAQTMMQGWMDAQQTLWKNWANLATPAPAANPFSSDLMNQWMKMAQQNMESMMGGSAPIAQSTAGQFLMAQGMVMRFLEFSTRAWQATAPKFASGGDWQSALRQSVEQTRQAWMSGPADAAGATRDTEKLWQLYLEQWKSFGEPWQAAFRQMPTSMGQAMMGKGSAVVDMSNEFRDAYNQTIGKLANSPNLGLNRELNQKMSLAFDAFVAQNLANLEYQGILSEMWDQAFQNFANDLIKMAEEDKKVETVRDLIMLWTRGAEQVFTTAFRTEKYVLAQGKLLSASMTYRQRQREVMEVYLKMYDIPTRTELDETHRRIYELRKQVKALQKQVATLNGNADEKTARRKAK